MARVNDGSHSFTCHPHVYPQVEWTIPAFIPQPQSITTLWLVLISHPTEGSRLSWPGWLGEIVRWLRRSPIPVLTGPDVEWLRWYAQRCYHYATPPPSSSSSSNYVPVLYSFLDTVTHWLKIAKFLPFVSNAPVQSVCNGIWPLCSCEKNYNDGASSR